jgi:hypothetical protein
MMLWVQEESGGWGAGQGAAGAAAPRRMVGTIFLAKGVWSGDGKRA